MLELKNRGFDVDTSVFTVEDAIKALNAFKEEKPC